MRNPNPLAQFWSRGICHAGILDTPVMTSRSQTLAAVATLKEINSLLDIPRQRGNPCITALTVPDPELDWSLEYAMNFRDLDFNPHLLISLGHYRFGDNTVKDCAIMPPTRHPFDTPPDDITNSYNYDLATTVYSIREFYLKTMNIRGLVSVTMKGRWTVPLSSDKVDFFSRCLSDPTANSFGSYTEVCPRTSSEPGDKNRTQFTYSDQHCAMITYIPSINRAFVYDNEEGLAVKLCSAKSDYPELKFGIAAFDIEYDDYDNKCASLNMYGRNSRLKQLKMVVDYFRGHSNHNFKEEACRVLWE
nr:uncharacterized protein LOC129383602 [Dermacentor andersoni]